MIDEADLPVNIREIANQELEKLIKR